MKIKEYIDYLNKEWNGIDDRSILKPLVACFSPVSKQTILKAQPKQFEDSKGNFKAFADAQANEIKQCVELEISELGVLVRQNLGLPILTLETEI
jgi:hypothetical protein